MVIDKGFEEIIGNYLLIGIVFQFYKMERV